MSKKKLIEYTVHYYVELIGWFWIGATLMHRFIALIGLFTTKQN